MSLNPRVVITALSHANGFPLPVFEHRFHAVRRWRLDVAFLPLKVAIEIEGGAFTNGRHTRGAGFVADLEKYNAAALDGWTVLRYTPKQIASGSWTEDIKHAMSVQR